MTKETKQDVFEELLDAYDDAKSSDGNLHPTQELLDYDDRYADALPDEIALIPEAVGKYIKYCKGEGGVYSLIDAMEFADDPSEDWLHDTPANIDAFARAWLDGVWRVEETGEIVKLEAEK
ncbi:DUF1642 domain-containing protein [Lacticaseibacillus yichunensis]|uniref:DUF1642 domain-containing protein n=1 Tax=Lacticaseibacillus yichunensis TaxID=2486015 RepID=A0ABW4CM61_9LACO|nr:DUF1642 domain-containing protein [Lacticaseibacillus yichunensis]